MQQVSEIIISDTSSLIVLGKINALELLKELAKEVFITSEIQTEYGRPLPKWIKVKDAANTKLKLLLEAEVDRGEASAIALAISTSNAILILDDLTGKKTCREARTSVFRNAWASS